MMSMATAVMTGRERELGAIIRAYNEVTERLKQSHETLIAEVARLREQVEEKNRELARRERLAALGEMAAGVAHEIRNPLSGIQLYAALLVRDLADRPPQQALAAKIQSGVRALEGIVGDILAFAGESRPQPVRVSLGGAVRECLELAAPSRSAWETRIELGEGLDEIQVQVDAGQLQRALLNLLFNAMEAAGRRGAVRVTAAPAAGGRWCDVAVEDNGPGIPPDLLNRVFNPFFTTKDSGTGLGLAIVHRIVEAHGGRVRAENRPGGGAAFTMTLPLGAGG